MKCTTNTSNSRIFSCSQVRITFVFSFIVLACSLAGRAQDTLAHRHPPVDTVKKDQPVMDTTLRIVNVNPYFTLHVDSVLQYAFQINKPAANYYWYLKKAPVGIRLDRNTGNLFFKAEKSFFKSGKLRYDEPYQIQFGVQSLLDATEKVDTSCTIVFYSTEIVPSRLKPTIGSTFTLEEGDSIKFRVQCDEGSFPTEQITMFTNIPISGYRPLQRCGDQFEWTVPYDFIKENDTAKQRMLIVSFVGADKFFNRDTAEVRLIIRPGLDYPSQNKVHARAVEEMQQYIAELKLTFYAVSSSVKKNRSTRTGFDVTGSSTALAGTILSTAGGTPGAQNTGKILPSVGLTLVPVKEAVAPNKLQEQNTATQIRTVIKRLEYLLTEHSLIGDKDVNVVAKTKKLQDELRQARQTLIDLPIIETNDKVNQETADKYFKDPKVNKKYKLKVN